MIVKAQCGSVSYLVKFRLNKETFVEIPQDGTDPWFTTRREFRRFLREKNGLGYRVAWSSKVVKEDIKRFSSLPPLPNRDVRFFPAGAFQVGCMFFEKGEAVKIRQWVRGNKKK